MDLTVFLSWLPAAIAAIKDQRLRRKYLSSEGKAAIRNLLRAVRETELYIKEVRSGGTVVRSREEDLARLWTEASSSLRGVDNEMAKRAHLKAGYWTEPESWTEEMLFQANILLAQVSIHAEEMLGWED